MTRFPSIDVPFRARSGPDRCVTCDSDGTMAPYRTVKSWQLVRCTRCGLVSLSGAGSGEETVSEANEPFYSSGELSRWFLSHEDLFRRRYRDDLRQIAVLEATGWLLDVGCGPGLFLDEARKAGWKVQGVEASSAPAMVARERFGVPVFVGSLEQAKLPREGFDVVTFFDVLEHLPAPRRVLEEAIALLKPGGLLVAQSPNLRSLMAWLTGDLWHWYVLPNHLHHFTPSTMERLLHSAGLTPVHTITLDVPEEFANNLQDRFPRLRGPSALKVFLRRALNRSLRAGTRAWAPGGFGGLVRCFARKSG